MTLDQIPERWVSQVVQWVKNLSVRQETQVLSLGREDPLEKGMATHSSTFAWWEPGGSLVGYSPWGRKESDTAEETKHDACTRKVGFMTVGSKLRDSIRLILYP